MTTLWEAPLLDIGRRRGDRPLRIDDLEYIPSNASYSRRQLAKSSLAQSAPVSNLHSKGNPYIVSKLSQSTKQVSDPLGRTVPRKLDGRTRRPTTLSSTATPAPQLNVPRAWRYQNLDSLNRFWNTFHIPEGERIYAYRQIQRNRTLAQAYHRRLTLLLSYRRQYDEAMASRRETLQDLSRFLIKMKGSRTDLTYCVTRLRYLTFKISSILNLARIVCHKPISYPDLLLSVTDLSNWNLYLKQEAFYNRNTTAIIFTVLKFFGQRTFQEVQNIVNKYFDRCTKGKNYLEKCSVLQGPRDPDISYSCVSKRSQLNVSCIAPVTAEQAASTDVESMMHISEDDVSLYLLLGLEAEAIFDGDNLAVKWNEFLSKRNGAYFQEDDPAEMQRFGKADWVPLLKPQNVRDMIILEPMIQKDVTRMLRLLDDNHERPVIIPLRSDITPFETYFVKPCIRKRILARKAKETCNRLSQPKHAVAKKQTHPKKRAASKTERGPRPAAQPNRPSSRAAAGRVQRAAATRPPPPSVRTEPDQDTTSTTSTKSLSILPAIGSNQSTKSAVRMVPSQGSNVLLSSRVPSHFTSPQPKKESQGPTVLQVIETLMSVLPRLESPRNAQTYDRFIYLQTRGIAGHRPDDVSHAGGRPNEDASAKQPLPPQLNISNTCISETVQNLVTGLESPVSIDYPECIDRLWTNLNKKLLCLKELNSFLAATPSATDVKNGLGRSTMMESIIDLPTSCLSPRNPDEMPQILTAVINLNPPLFSASQHEDDDSTQTESPDFGISDPRSVVSGNRLLVTARSAVSISAPVDLNSNLLASLPSGTSAFSPPQNECLTPAIPYVDPVVDLSMPSDISQIRQPSPTSTSEHFSLCCIGHNDDDPTHIFTSLSSSAESTLCNQDREHTAPNTVTLNLPLLDVTVSTSVDDPQPTPLERYGVPVMNFNKIVYKLDEKAIQRQPNLIQYREKFRHLYTEDRSSSDYDYIDGEFVPISKKLAADTSDNEDLLEYKDHYFDKPFLGKKFRKIEKKQRLLSFIQQSLSSSKSLITQS